MNDTTMRNGPVRGKWPGVAAIDIDGDRYCLDCAKEVLNGQEVSYQTDSGEWHTVTNADGNGIVEQLISGDIHTLSMGGVVLRNSTDVTDSWHCGLGADCTNSIDGNEHSYDHEIDIGVKLDI